MISLMIRSCCGTPANQRLGLAWVRSSPGSSHSLSFVVHRLAISFVLASFFLASCSGLNFGGNAANEAVIPMETPVVLAQLQWCAKPVIIFRDEGTRAPTNVTPTATTATTTETPTLITGSTPVATTLPGTEQPTIVTNWSQVESKLGFSVYLPQALPQNTCLVSVSGTLHDPIFGGSFTIGYLLPDHSSISLAEAPLRSQSRQFQCTPSSNIDSPKTGSPAAGAGSTRAILQVCSGVLDNTSIVFSARGSTDYLQRFFAALQPDINWVPGS